MFVPLNVQSDKKLKIMNYKLLYNKNAWAIIAILFCSAMVSGQMWNHIKGPPFVPKTQNDPYILESTRGQFGLESYIVMVFNTAVVLGMILMIEAIQYNRDETKGIILTIIGLLLVTVFFSLMLLVFRTKTQGRYPFR